jgi:hypothetical protein
MASKRKPSKRRKTSVERKFEVRAEVANFTLAKAKSALRLQIYSRDEKFGELEIGRGSLRWWSARSPTEHRIPWARFAQIMDDLAHRKSRS